VPAGTTACDTKTKRRLYGSLPWLQPKTTGPLPWASRPKRAGSLPWTSRPKRARPSASGIAPETSLGLCRGRRACNEPALCVGHRARIKPGSLSWAPRPKRARFSTEGIAPETSPFFLPWASRPKRVRFSAAGINIVQSLQDSLPIAPHDTRPVERLYSVRSQLRRNANYDMYHTGMDMYRCRDDAYFDRLARHIDDNYYKSTA
jgi:hypothetical protein